jgi:PhoH-like ATPase
MSPSVLNEKRIFVVDTNVLLHDPTAIFRFKEHDVYVPMMVLEELDAAKRGTSELARSARQVSRFIEELIGDGGRDAIESGLLLPTITNVSTDHPPSGRLYLQTAAVDPRLHADALRDASADSTILSVALWVAQRYSDTSVTLVSKDINLRIKARVAGVHAEDYYNDKTLDDVDLLCRGIHELNDEQWAQLESSG